MISYAYIIRDKVDMIFIDLSNTYLIYLLYYSASVFVNTTPTSQNLHVPASRQNEMFVDMPVGVCTRFLLSLPFLSLCRQSPQVLYT